MAYTSEVAIAVCDEKREGLIDVLAKHGFLDREALPVFENEYVVFFDDNIKWRRTDKGVGAVMKYLYNLEPYEYGVLRIGDDDCDFEEWGEPYEYGIRYIRKIDIVKNLT